MNLRVAVLVAVLVVAGCGGDDDTDEKAEPEGRTSTTAEPADAAGSSDAWTFTSSNGETFTVNADEDTAFTGNVPTPVAMIDGAKDCAAVESERDFWTEAAESNNSDEYRANAAAYVAYANDRLAKLGC